MKRHHHASPGRRQDKPGWGLAAIVLLGCILVVSALFAVAIARLIAVAMVAVQVALS